MTKEFEKKIVDFIPNRSLIIESIIRDKDGLEVKREKFSERYQAVQFQTNGDGLYSICLTATTTENILFKRKVPVVIFFFFFF
jgi:hypothetical protein